MAKKELTVDEHNAAVAKEISKHEDAIKDLQKEYKSEIDQKQASLHECNVMSRKKHKK